MRRMSRGRSPRASLVRFRYLRHALRRRLPVRARRADGLRRDRARLDHLAFEDDLDADGAAAPDEALEIDLRRDEETAGRGGIEEQLRRRATRTQQLADVRVVGPEEPR